MSDTPIRRPRGGSALMAIRYGVKAGRQYEGFKALPERTEETMSTTAAADYIAKVSSIAAPAIISDSQIAQRAIRAVRAKTHPDAGGNAHDFHVAGLAKKALENHFGRAL